MSAEVPVEVTGARALSPAPPSAFSRRKTSDNDITVGLDANAILAELDCAAMYCGINVVDPFVVIE